MKKRSASSFAFQHDNMCKNVRINQIYIYISIKYWYETVDLIDSISFWLLFFFLFFEYRSNNWSNCLNYIQGWTWILYLTNDNEHPDKKPLTSQSLYNSTSGCIEPLVANLTLIQYWYMYKYSQVKGALQSEFMNQKTPGLSIWDYDLTRRRHTHKHSLWVNSGTDYDLIQGWGEPKAELVGISEEYVTLCKDFKLFYSFVLFFLLVYI